jgi:putative cell wall-binding protein
VLWRRCCSRKSNASGTLSWTAPTDNGGSVVTGYVITPSDRDPHRGNVTTTTITGLTNGVGYTFTVAAINDVGAGTDSAASTSVTPTAGGGGAGTPTATVRFSGGDRFGTAIAAAGARFPTAGSAGAVVLARSDDYADALVGTPLAAAKNAPLLFAQGGSLTVATKAEIQRVLPVGGTVYLLGGSAAIPASVAAALTDLGYATVRYAGDDRYGTALAVAHALGDPNTVLLATGTNFPDALTAGPAAAHIDGVVLLTDGSVLPAAVKAYLAAHPGTVYAVGGPAAAADPLAVPLMGVDRYASAVAVATALFDSPITVGVASGMTYPDALSGGAFEALAGGPILLSTPTSLPTSTSVYLTGAKDTIITSSVFGGASALSESLQTAVGTALGW